MTLTQLAVNGLRQWMNPLTGLARSRDLIHLAVDRWLSVSLLILKELAEMSAAYKKNVEEVEQLTGLLDQMSKAKPAGS